MFHKILRESTSALLSGLYVLQIMLLTLKFLVEESQWEMIIVMLICSKLTD